MTRLGGDRGDLGRPAWYVEGNGKIYKGGGSVSAGNTTDSVKIQAYWIRIDVRANGSCELRGGLNG